MPLFCWFDNFLYPRAENCQNFRCFFGKFKISKRHSEINWPLVVYINCSECQNKKQFVYTTCSELAIFMFWTRNSMNNLSSYCGLVDAKIRASDKDLPVQALGTLIFCSSYVVHPDLLKTLFQFRICLFLGCSQQY